MGAAAAGRALRFRFRPLLADWLGALSLELAAAPAPPLLGGEEDGSSCLPSFSEPLLTISEEDEEELSEELSGGSTGFGYREWNLFAKYFLA